MFQKIKGFLSKFKNNRTVGEKLSEMHLRHAQLSEALMLSLGVAIKLELKVYIRVDVGNRSHGLSVQGKDDPTLQYLYELANESMKDSCKAALEADLEDRTHTDGMEGIGGDGRKRAKTGL